MDELQVGDWVEWLDNRGRKVGVLTGESKLDFGVLSVRERDGSLVVLLKAEVRPWSPEPGELCEGVVSSGDEEKRRGTFLRWVNVGYMNEQYDGAELTYGVHGAKQLVTRASLRPALPDTGTDPSGKSGEQPPGLDLELDVLKQRNGPNSGVTFPGKYNAPDPYLAHMRRLAELPEAEQEKMLAWYAEQDTRHELRHGPRIWHRVWDWEPPEDFEIFPRPA